MDGDRDHRDRLSQGRVRGRGAGLNPGNRFESFRLHILGEHLDAAAADNPSGVQVLTQVRADDTRSIINHVDSPDLGFHWTLNPYRGCEHGCIYCYARPTHEYLGFSLGLDFETRIVAKHDAPALLRKAILSSKWCGEPIMMSGVTDPYQPVEAKLGITRACLEVCLELRQPVMLITKNRLILRDLDLLRRLHELELVSAAVSVTTMDNALAATMEPRASSPGARLEAIRAIADLGIPVTVMMAPIIPGLNDHEIPTVLERAAKAGARRAGLVLLRLPHQIKDLFLDWLKRNFPDRAAKVESKIRDARGGELYDARFFARQKGGGPRAEQILQAFRVFQRRFGLDQEVPALRNRQDSGRSAQMPLFGA